MSLSPFPMHDALATKDGRVTVTWREWILNLYAEVTNIVARIVTLEAATAAGEHDSDGTHNWGTVTPTFSAGTFTGSGSLTWDVAEANVYTHEYGMLGDRLLLTFHVRDTNVSGVASDELRIALPSGYVASGWASGSLYYADAGGTLTAGVVLVSPGLGYVALYQSPLANWTVTAGSNTRVIGSILLRVEAA